MCIFINIYGYTDSDCPFVIFKLFFTVTYIYFPLVTILHARFYENSKYRHVTDRCMVFTKKAKPFLNVFFGRIWKTNKEN